MAFKRSRRIKVTATVRASDYGASFAESREDDRAQWFYLRCVQAFTAIGRLRRSVVSDRGSRMEFSTIVRVPVHQSTADITAALRAALPRLLNLEVQPMYR